MGAAAPFLAKWGTHIAAGVAAGAAVGSTVQQRRAAREDRRANEQAAAIERRAASIENARRARRAVAEARIQRASMIQMGETEGLRASSPISGASGSVVTQTASNIGAAGTQLAANTGVNLNLIRGARRAGVHRSNAAMFGTVSDLSMSFAPLFGPKK